MQEIPGSNPNKPKLFSIIHSCYLFVVFFHIKLYVFYIKINLFVKLIKRCSDF